jgi:predicted dehydrogenase
MTEKIRLGILGTGNMAHEFAKGLQHAVNVELIAVASRRQDSADRFAGEFELTKSFAHYEALAADPDVDLAYVSTPHSCHLHNSLMCLEAGKPVICEKPFTINAQEASLLIETAREKRLFLMEAMWTRYIPAIVRLRELLADNAIGQLQVMLAGGAFMPPFDPDAYLFRPDLGGGVLLDAGVYPVSMASMIFGSPTKVLAAGSIADSGIDEQVTALLQNENGSVASMYVSLRANAAPDITLLGDRGKIHVHAPMFAPSKLTLKVGDAKEEVLQLPFAGNGYQFEAVEAANCIMDGRTESAVMPLGETLTIMQTMDEIRRQLGIKYPMEV